MTAPQVIVVFGATGAQGGSVIRALKNDPKYHVKAATRSPDSEKAKKLAEQGVEVVKVDMDDAASCKEALKGAYGVFLVTNYWELFDIEREVTQGKNVVDAAKEHGIQHLVFSGLKSAKENIGKEGCAHFESKKVIYDYIQANKVPVTTVDLSFYYENLITFLKARRTEAGIYVMELPMGNSKLDMICVEEVGEIVHQIFLDRKAYLDKWVALASDQKTVSEIAAQLTKVTGEPFEAGKMTPDEFAKLGFPGAGDLAVMFEYFASGKYDHDIETTRRLNPAIPTFEQWTEKNRQLLIDAFKDK